MKVLIFGTSSFAAQGLQAALENAGHEVWTFDRGAAFAVQGRNMRGPYDQLQHVVETLGTCDAVVDYAIVKFGNIEDNLRLVRQVLECAKALQPSRFIYISSVSVLPADVPVVNESSPTADHPYKGEYSRVKVLAENTVREEWKHSSLLILRPSFVIGEGILDPMVGMGRLLPTGHVMGMGSRRTVMPMVKRETLHECVEKMLILPLGSHDTCTFMAAMPKPPEREEYLAFMCREFGRGLRPVHFPAWLWRAGLFCVSLPLSLLKRRWMRLDRTFEHNLNYREYDATRTERELGIQFDFDWQARLKEIEHRDRNVAWPGHPITPQHTAPTPVPALRYYGLGRITKQRHLPALQRLGFKGIVEWSDPLVEEPPPEGARLTWQPTETSSPSQATHAVITAPCHHRTTLLKDLPSNITHVLLEKPFAIDAPQAAAFREALAGRKVFVLHNYRFKPNCLAFRKHLQTHPPGRMRRVSIHFETPSPAHELVSWMRQERRHRVLLIEYGMHFLDMAWLFFEGPMRINRCDTTDNDRGEVESISADLSFDNGTCAVLMRQGCHQRQALITYDFQNYSVQLRFFPDIFAPVVGGLGMGDDVRLGFRGFSATAAKVMEKLGVRVDDRSHEHVLAAFTGHVGPEALEELSLEALTPFYERLISLADSVYGPAEQ